jgi:hypothetical protein
MRARYRSRILATHFLLAAAAIIATPAQAAVDMTGPWRVGFAAFGMIVESRFDFVQAGTDLSGNGYSGTIDPDTGVFELSKTKFCLVFPNPNPIPVTATISGTVAPDGQSFTGTALDYVQSGRTCFAVDAQTQGLRLPPGCGDGDLDPDEACDPGVSSQCCTPYCTPNGPGLLCTDDGNPCTSDVCDGAGACEHTAGNGGTTCRLATGQCDAPESCTGASTTCPPDLSQPDGTSCSDGNACTNPDVCTAGACTSGSPVVCPLCETCDTVGGCVEAPRPACKQPTKPLKASILLQDRTLNDLDQVKWKWSNGQATTFAELGAPLTSDDYALCVYDATSQLLFKMTAPAGDMCGTKPCWKQLGSSLVPKGYKYKDLDGLPHDLDSMTLKAGLDGKAKITLKGKGPNIPMPALGSFALPLTIQMQSGNGACWEATTTAPDANTTSLFKAKAD